MITIAEKFAELKERRETGLIAYLTAGYPTEDESRRLFNAAAESGADILEIGIPFSDPVADGPVIQESSQQALKNGMNLRTILRICRDLNGNLPIPHLLMGYYNPILRFGLRRFANACAEGGVAGIIVPDLPPEECVPLRKELGRHAIPLIRFVTPYTRESRIKTIVSDADGFVYCISQAGVTGTGQRYAKTLLSRLDRIRRLSPAPVAVGFGISLDEQIRELKSHADAIIMGSALIRAIAGGGCAAMKKLIAHCKDTLRSAP